MNKYKIRPYLKKLLVANFLYIIVDLAIVVLIFTILKIGLGKIYEINGKADALNKDISELQRRFNLLNTVVPSAAELDNDITMLNSLIPNSEDYFSIIYSLDRISQNTGFVITSYTVNISQSNANKLNLTVTGTGDTKSFVNFLNNYNFGGGRLITSDKIELNPEMSGDINISLSFYNKKVSTDNNQNAVINEKVMTDISALRNKINFSLKEVTSSGSLDFSYPKKTNPF